MRIRRARFVVGALTVLSLVVVVTVSQPASSSESSEDGTAISSARSRGPQCDTGPPTPHGYDVDPDGTSHMVHVSETDVDDEPKTPTAPAPPDWEANAFEVADGEELAQQAVQHFGCRFGGQWMEGDGEDSTYVLGVVEPTREDHEWLAQTDQTGRSRIAATPEGYADLERWADQVTVVAQKRGLRQIVVEPHAQTGTVRVQGKQLPSQFRQAAADRVPSERLKFIERADFKYELTHSNRQNWNAIILHYEAGLAVNVNGGGCTTGFYVYNSTFGPFGTTAGHCGNVNAPVASPQGGFNDQIRANAYFAANPTDSDAATFSTASVYNYPRVMQSSTTHRNVANRYSLPNPPNGTGGVCRIGASSNNALCGTINLANAPAIDDRGRTVRVWCFNDPVQLGDSGGPTYSIRSDGRVQAAGIIHGFATLGGVVSTCYTHVYYVLSRLNASLVYG